jgi:hypothetical protein
MIGTSLLWVAASGNQEEDLEIDDTLGALEKIRRYINSDLILHRYPCLVLPHSLLLSHAQAHAPPHTRRLYLVRELSEYAKEVGYEDTVSQLLPYLKEIQRVRTHSSSGHPLSVSFALCLPSLPPSSLFRFSPERLLAA